MFLTSCSVTELPGKNVSGQNLLSRTLQHKNTSSTRDCKNEGSVTCLCTEQDICHAFTKKDNNLLLNNNTSIL